MEHLSSVLSSSSDGLLFLEPQLSPVEPEELELDSRWGDDPPSSAFLGQAA